MPVQRLRAFDAFTFCLRPAVSPMLHPDAKVTSRSDAIQIVYCHGARFMGWVSSS
jgi:hypothetical protein